jgi:cell division protein FtsL
MLIAILLLWGLLLFFNWAILKVGAEFDDVNERILSELKKSEESARGNGE